jgi:hypothetical protein
MPRHHFTEERVGVGVVDDDGEEAADLARVAVEDDDAVAVGAAGELERAGFTWTSLSETRIRVSERRGHVLLARAFDEHFHFLTQKRLVVFLTDVVLEG